MGNRWLLGTGMACALSMAVVAACGSSAEVATPVADPASPADSQAGVRPVIVDTDVSLDDVMAILYLLQRPDVDVLAITVSGNGLVRCDAGVSIVLGLLAVAEQADVPVACGSESPLEGANSFPDPWRDARDAMATSGILPAGGEPSTDSAATVMAAAAAAASAPPTMLLLGTHTNLAQALRDHPDLEGALAGIHIMGGAVDVPGNTLDNPDAEWNLWIDPTAVAEVFATDLPLSIVPLDATQFVPMTEAFASLLAANLTSPEAEASLALLRLDPGATTSGLSMWDQLAVAALVEPTVVSWANRDVAIDGSTDPQRGGTLTVGAGRPARVAVNADPLAFETEYLTTLAGQAIARPTAVTVSAERVEYIALADAVCTAANADAEGVYTEVLEGVTPDAPPTAALMAELWQRLDPILRTQISDLRELTPPADDASALDALYNELDEVIDGVSATVEAAVGGDADALATITGQSGEGDPFGDVNRRAREFGFQVCGASE